MLTAVFSALALGEAVNLPVLIAQQIVFGAAFGLAFGWVGMKLACRMNLESQNETIVLIAIALLSFAVPSQLGGNGISLRVPGGHRAGRLGHSLQARDGACL